MRKRNLLLGGLSALGLGLLGLAWPRPMIAYEPPALDPVSDPDAWVAAKQAESRSAGAWEVAVERLVRHSEGRTPEAILYIHGFGATRAEGEQVMDQVAQERGANLYYLRLPGHGTTTEDHAATTARQYLDAAAEALALMPSLGDRTVVVGTSTGGLLATWLAAEWPDRVDALVVASPLYAFKDAYVSPLIQAKGGPALVTLAMGADRSGRWEDPRKLEGYDERWLLDQKLSALVPLEQVRRFIVRDQLLGKVRAPTLALVHYASEQEQDNTISVAAVREVMGKLGGGQPGPGNRLVEIADGNHVLMSEFVRTDKELVLSELRAFLDEVVGPVAETAEELPPEELPAEELPDGGAPAEAAPEAPTD